MTDPAGPEFDAETDVGEQVASPKTVLMIQRLVGTRAFLLSMARNPVIQDFDYVVGGVIFAITETWEKGERKGVTLQQIADWIQRETTTAAKDDSGDVLTITETDPETGEVVKSQVVDVRLAVTQVKTIRQAIQRLERCGLIAVGHPEVQGRGKPNLYGVRPRHPAHDPYTHGEKEFRTWTTADLRLHGLLDEDGNVTPPADPWRPHRTTKRRLAKGAEPPAHLNQKGGTEYPPSGAKGGGEYPPSGNKGGTEAPPSSESGVVSTPPPGERGVLTTTPYKGTSSKGTSSVEGTPTKREPTSAGNTPPSLAAGAATAGVASSEAGRNDNPGDGSHESSATTSVEAVTNSSQDEEMTGFRLDPGEPQTGGKVVEWFGAFWRERDGTAMSASRRMERVQAADALLASGMPLHKLVWGMGHHAAVRNWEHANFMEDHITRIVRKARDWPEYDGSDLRLWMLAGYKVGLDYRQNVLKKGA